MMRARHGRWWRLGLFLVLVPLGSCGNPLGPGTEWLVGAWRLVLECGAWSCGGAVAPDRMLLTLDDDGGATVHEMGVRVLTTGFRAGRDRSAAGIPYTIWFDDAVAGSKQHVLPSAPTDSIWLNHYPWGCDDCQEYRKFARVE